MVTGGESNLRPMETVSGMWSTDSVQVLFAGDRSWNGGDDQQIPLDDNDQGPTAEPSINEPASFLSILSYSGNKTSICQLPRHMTSIDIRRLGSGGSECKLTF